MGGESIARADRAVRSRHSRQAVRPSLGAVRYSDNLNDVTFDPIGDKIRRVRDDEFAGAGHATRSAEGRRCRQTRQRRPNSLDHAVCSGRVVRGNALANVSEPAKIAGGGLQTTRRDRGWHNRLYRSCACFSDRASPESSSLIPAVISAICHSLSSTYAAIASAARNDFERLVLRASASSFAFSAASIRVVMTVVSAALMPDTDSARV